jgi:hypothetical protein
MVRSISRRTLLGAATVAGSTLLTRHVQAASSPPSLPLGWPDLAPGQGFRIGHGFQTENTWYLPGYWHCAEDWYAIDRNTAGALVYALTDGEVVFVGSDYPGRVVIIRHADDLYSMYGHLDYAVDVSERDTVKAGDRLGTVYDRTDGRAPSHLHYEVRTFLTTADVNGPNPRYGFGCGPNCAPGPGYWPMNAPDLPVDQGWRNPMHVYGQLLDTWRRSTGGNIVITIPEGADVPVWNGPPDQSDRKEVTGMTIQAGDKPTILAIETGRASTRQTSAEGYSAWFQIEEDWFGPWIPWVQSSRTEIGSDGRPSSVDLLFTIHRDLVGTIVAD